MSARPSPKGTVVFISGAPRTGTTLICQILQEGGKDGRVVSYAEMDIFTVLTRFYKTCSLPRDKIQNVLKGSVDYICRSMTNHQTYVLKSRSRGIILTELIHEAYSGYNNVHFLFICRKDVKATMLSMDRALHSFAGNRSIWLYVQLCKWLPSVASYLCGWLDYFITDSTKYNITSFYDLVVYWSFEPYSYYLQQKWVYDDFFQMHGPLRYEDFTLEAHLPEAQLRLKHAFSIAGLDPGQAEDARLRATARDSQAGTPMSREAQRVQQVTAMDDDLLDRAKQVTHNMLIPDTFWVHGIDILQ